MQRRKLGTKAAPIYIADGEALTYWLETAPKGEWACYWRGDLHAARYGMEFMPEARVRLARQIGSAAWKAYEDKRVCLVQGRYGKMGFQYFAVKRADPYPIPRAARGGR